MEPIPSPAVINVDFKAKPADEAEPVFPPDVSPTPPAPFRKRSSFLPVRFFSAKRLPPGIPPGADDEKPDAANVSSAAEAAAVGEIGSGTSARPLLTGEAPATPEPAPAAPVELTPVPVAGAAGASTPLPPPPPPEAAAASVPSPVPSPALVPLEPAVREPASLPVAAPEPLASAPAVLAPPSAPQPPPAPAADTGSRTDVRGAAVQLTFSGEIAALRLTPSFQLGAVQLRALSDVVSLRLVAPGATENPLDAAVAFQIVHAELDPASRRLKNLLLKPLDEARGSVTPRPRLQVAQVGLIRGGDRHASITVAAAAQSATAVQLFGTFVLGSLQFTPHFGVATLRLELASDTVLVRVTPSANPPTARDLPPSFGLAGVELDADGRLAGLNLTAQKG